ncbi:MAG: S1 RNA-binding domain-containing protein, partial [Methylocystis sp.]|nr:S1 RNA-binding domain-containing protein [Methylocystis sp.]
MANKMLIDASHPEETRVVVLRGSRVQEFDFEAADKKPLRGNIYLAKVTRVEPSLQAAFVDYGGNRHGFLAFAEIHPDYYQIPVADRQALLEEESRAHQQADEEERVPHGRGRRSRRRQHEGVEKRASSDEAVTSEPLDDAGASPIVIEDQAETGFAESAEERSEAAPEFALQAESQEYLEARPVPAETESRGQDVEAEEPEAGNAEAAEFRSESTDVE